MDIPSLKAWGTNNNGQLGLKQVREQEENPKCVVFEYEVIDVSCGGSHSLLLTSKGVYSAGLNDMCQLGRGVDAKYSSEFSNIIFNTDSSIVQLAAGWDFNLARTGQGMVFCWGGNKFQQIGCESEVVPFPTRLELGSPAEFISAGTRFSVIIYQNAELIEVLGKVRRGVDTEPRRRTLRHPNGLKFVSASCGEHHFFVLDNSGDIWTYGCNKFGQRGPESEDNKLTKFKFDIQGDVIADVKSGWSFGVILTRNGQVFTWGRNVYGQLGRTTDKPVDDVIRRIDLANIKKIAVGSEHCFALTDDGCLYSWGWNEHGNCGNGNVENLRLPVVLFSNRRKEVKDVWSGHGHNFLLFSESSSYRVEILHVGYAIDKGDHFKANCTCTLITGPLKVIVDTMTPWDKDFILEELRNRCIRPEDIDYVISTHGHSDHVGNNNLFLSAKHIVGYCISNKDSYWMHPFDSDQPYVIDGDELVVVPTPGHTADDVSVVVKTGELGTVAVAGDTFERLEDIFDPSIWRSAGSVDPEKQERNRLRLASTSHHIIPGHGPMFNVTDEMRKELHRQRAL